MKGRKPDPASVRRRKGNPGRRPIPEAPEPPADTGKAPDWLSPPAKKHWSELAPELIRQGLLTVMDRTALGIICEHLATWRAARDTARSEGCLHPANIEMRRQALVLHKYLAEFGFTPSSRIRLALQPEKEQSRVEGILAKKQALESSRN